MEESSRSSRHALRQGALVLGVGAAVALALWMRTALAGCQPFDAAFWFEDVSFDSATLGGPLTPPDLDAIETRARQELYRAFAGLRIVFSDRRGSNGIRVVQELRDMRFRRVQLIPAESRAVTGLGGQGAVSFSWLASGAVSFAPSGATRAEMLEAIGTGIGRAAVHEFVHIILPRAPIHDSRDVASYEYRSAARRQQYFGEMRWDLAWPLLQERLAPCRA